MEPVTEVDKGFPALNECLVPAALPLFPRVLPIWESDFGGSMGHVQGTWPLPPASAGEVPVAESASC